MTTKEEFLAYMTKQLLVEYTLWLNYTGKGIPILDTVEQYLASDKANIGDFIKVIADPEPFLILGAKDNG